MDVFLKNWDINFFYITFNKTFYNDYWQYISSVLSLNIFQKVTNLSSVLQILENIAQATR